MSGKSLPRKRAHLLVDEESDDIDLPCPQCGTELEGFHCNQNTVHLQCQACGGMMPSRTDISVPQHFLGCEELFVVLIGMLKGLREATSTLFAVVRLLNQSQIALFLGFLRLYMKRISTNKMYRFLYHKEVYYSDGQNIAGCCLQIGLQSSTTEKSIEQGCL